MLLKTLYPYIGRAFCAVRTIRGGSNIGVGLLIYRKPRVRRLVQRAQGQRRNINSFYCNRNAVGKLVKGLYTQQTMTDTLPFALMALQQSTYTSINSYPPRIAIERAFSIEPGSG